MSVQLLISAPGLYLRVMRSNPVLGEQTLGASRLPPVGQTLVEGAWVAPPMLLPTLRFSVLPWSLGPFSCFVVSIWSNVGKSDGHTGPLHHCACVVRVLI